MTVPSDYTGDVTVGGVHYHVTPEYLAQAVADTNSTADEIANQLSDLQQYVQSVEAAWGGIAADQFNILMTDYRLYATMLHDALTDIAQGLQGNYINYVDSEGQNINNLIALGEDIPAPPVDTNFN
ncbi:WXG100 family type VII secretion target [Actinoallomurus rhizosphaericola]|uniref:WXG100 family type VII secretion target n=1 Tax=Actinoallomurus rhizosphaericola TaxID=2952536 RepID=UPI0020920D69|nr:WXG100 family type VII secretion target [Actinoallomurus rhizosphaericola]MCO6000300.1 WXG100 family type VII secretion target [Actinoallomurus rhizosphaericola]